MEGKTSENKNLQGSVVSYTEIKEVIFENNTGSESGEGLKGGAERQDKIKR